jgi:hypothetical protein
MTIDIPIRTSNNNDKEKHGNVFPSLRVSPANPGEEMGQADDARLNALFGTEEDSFFNRFTNSLGLVAVAALSGQDHYRMGGENDTFVYDGNSAMASKLASDLRIANSNRDAEKVRIINLKIAKLKESTFQEDETQTEFNPNNPAEDENFNPDFSASSVSWRYTDTSSNRLNDKSKHNDNVGENKYPNLSYPMIATSSDTGNINLEQNVDYNDDQPENNNFGSNTQTRHDKNVTDMFRILNRYEI